MESWTLSSIGPRDVYYRPPLGSRLVLIRTERPGRGIRYHQGAHLGNGPLLVPEACNLDQATSITDLGAIPLPEDAHELGRACRRCFPE